MSERILIIQMAKLGDFIQTTPLLANLRLRRPDAEVVVAAEQAAALEAAHLSPVADTVVEIGEGPESLEHLGDFREVFVLNSHRRAVRLAGTVKAKNRFGPGQDRDGLRFTAAQNFLMALMSLRRDLGRFNLVDVWTSLLPGATPRPLVWPKAAPSNLLPRDGSLKIGLQLGSRNHLRRWPVESFARLIVELTGLRPERTIIPVLLGSAGERALGAKFESLVEKQGAAAPVNLMGRTSLEELGRAAAGLDLLITADTGVMHLAAAVGTPVLALFFGPAYGPETGPYGEGHIIYQAAAPCAPCREGGDCRRRQCLEMPEPQIAARLAAQMIGGGDATETLPRNDMPNGHRVWRTAADGFGQSLRPLGRPVLTADEALAALITTAGRSVIRPEHQSAAEEMQAALAAHQWPDRPVAVDGRVISALAHKGFGGNSRGGAAFLEAVEKTAKAFGLKIA